MNIKKATTKRVKLEPLPKLLKRTEAIVNAWVRRRDEGKPCVSCGGYHKLQAGHFIPVGKCSYTRFDVNNIHGQCGGCNGPGSGNLIPYRIELRKRIGDFALEKLERDFIENRCHKWSRTELNEIIEKYRP